MISTVPDEALPMLHTLIPLSKLDIITQVDQNLIDQIYGELSDEGITIKIDDTVMHPVIFMHYITSIKLDEWNGIEITLGNYHGRLKILRGGTLYIHSDYPPLVRLGERLRTVINMYRAMYLNETGQFYHKTQ